MELVVLKRMTILAKAAWGSEGILDPPKAKVSGMARMSEWLLPEQKTRVPQPLNCERTLASAEVLAAENRPERENRLLHW